MNSLSKNLKQIAVILALTQTCPIFAKSEFTNPVISMRDAAVMRFAGYYYALGGETYGTIYSSKDLISWDSGTLAVTTDGATWLDDKQWTQANSYQRVDAPDLLYRNGVFHCYFNGIGHAYSATPTGPYKEQSLDAPFDNYGIDTQVFQDEDGLTYYVKKRNPSDPDPFTAAASTLDGPEIWTMKMNSPFSRWDITEGGMQLSHQPGHPTSLNHINFEGPELAKYRGHYYLFFVSNRMGPRSGMYEVGVAESDGPMNFNNSKKYPHPVLTRNTEQQLIEYTPIAPTAEHGGWDAKYVTTAPEGDWTAADYDDAAWTTGVGGFGRQEFDWFSNLYVTNAIVRARKTAWTTQNLYIRRTFTLESIPANVGMKLWVNGSATFYINGNKISIKASNNTYTSRVIDASWLKTGKNIVAIEASSSDLSNTSQQLVDFGFYDTGQSSIENIMICPAQPNFITGPNGFERWMFYKAFVNASEKQCIDRIHFYGHEPVVESTVAGSQGYHPAPSLPTIINYLDYAIYYPFKFLNSSNWTIKDKVMNCTDDNGGELLLRKDAETDYRFEVPFRLANTDDRMGVYAYYADDDNWVKIEVSHNGKWIFTDNTDGTLTSKEYDLPATFEFIDGNSLVASYDAPWHTLVVSKNVGDFHIMLDEFNLTGNGDIQTAHTGKGVVGLTASSPSVSFDAIQYTTGWDEYDNGIKGWNCTAGEWNTSADGLSQTSVDDSETLALKGDASWNYEFSTYMKTNGLQSSGACGFYPLYQDEDNYVKATINYATKTLDVESRDHGTTTMSSKLPLSNKVMRQYNFSNSSTYPTNSYTYELRNEAEVSGIDILWLEGKYPYLNQTFALPKNVYLFAMQDGAWKQLDATLNGESKLGVMNTYTFPSVKTTAIKVYVQNQTGMYSRAFCTYVHEDISSGYYLRARREDDGLHLFVDDQQKTVVSGTWGKAAVGLTTDKQKATYNGLMFYQTGGVKIKTITIADVKCNIGETCQLKTSVLPENATYSSLYWTSSAPDIVSVDDNGQITRHKNGYALITAYTTDGGAVKGTLELNDDETAINSIAVGDDSKATCSIYTYDGMKVGMCKDSEKEISTTITSNGIYVINSTSEQGTSSRKVTIKK